jgi:ParB family chromosome partitioning protein
MSAKHVGLGRGLGALIKEVPVEDKAPATEPESSPGVARLPIDSIRLNPWQPRKKIDPDTLEDLVASVREHGVLQPLLVRQAEDTYELIAGERRMTAARKAGLDEVPVVIMEADEQQALEIALIENLQREDLNLVEEAEGYKALCEQFKLTQEQVAERVGKGRPTVANALRLLKLPDDLREMIAAGALSGGHAKVLLGVEIEAEQRLLAKRVLREGLSVRALEKIVARINRPPRKPRAEKTDIPRDHVKYLVEQLHHHFGTGVRIEPCKTLANGKKVKGRVEIDFYSSDDLDRLLTMLGISENL